METPCDSGWSLKCLSRTLVLGDGVFPVGKKGSVQVSFSLFEVPLDIITNASEFGMSSDFKCLELFYEDMSSGNENSPFYNKMELYRNRYKIAFRDAMKLADLDIDLSGVTDAYQANTESIGRNKR